MTPKSFQAIAAMLNAFPQSAADAETLLRTYEAVLTSISDEAIQGAALLFIAGNVEGQNMRFAPSVAEFVKEAGEQQETIARREKLLLASPDEIIETWRKRLDYARRGRRWHSASWGPMPGTSGCRVPTAVLSPSDGKCPNGDDWWDEDHGVPA